MVLIYTIRLLFLSLNFYNNKKNSFNHQKQEALFMSKNQPFLIKQKSQSSIPFCCSSGFDEGNYEMLNKFNKKKRSIKQDKMKKMYQFRSVQDKKNKSLKCISESPIFDHQNQYSTFYVQQKYHENQQKKHLQLRSPKKCTNFKFYYPSNTQDKIKKTSVVNKKFYPVKFHYNQKKFCQGISPIKLQNDLKPLQTPTLTETPILKIKYATSLNVQELQDTQKKFNDKQSQKNSQEKLDFVCTPMHFGREEISETNSIQFYDRQSQIESKRSHGKEIIAEKTNDEKEKKGLIHSLDGLRFNFKRDKSKNENLFNRVRRTQTIQAQNYESSEESLVLQDYKSLMSKVEENRLVNQSRII